MGTVRFIPKEIKEQILLRIKNDGIPVAQAAKEHGVNPKSVYNWLRANTIQDTSILEISRLKRENRELLEIVGELTHELRKPKKNH